MASWKYNTMVFPSKVEAYWWVFLDRLGVEVLHEPFYVQTLKKKYRPDFYLPEHHAVIEVKSGNTNQWDLMAAQECAAQTGARTYIVDGHVPGTRWWSARDGGWHFGSAWSPIADDFEEHVLDQVAYEVLRMNLVPAQKSDSEQRRVDLRRLPSWEEFRDR